MPEAVEAAAEAVVAGAAAPAATADDAPTTTPTSEGWDTTTGGTPVRGLDSSGGQDTAASCSFTARISLEFRKHDRIYIQSI